MDGRFSIPLSLVNRAVREGIPFKSFREMVAHSAKITHPEGNRRFHNFLFKVEEGRVLDYKRVEQALPSRQVIRIDTPLTAAIQPRPKVVEVVPPVEVEPPEVDNTVYRCVTCKDTGKVVVYDECSYCERAGCRRCSGVGEVRRYIPCQDCMQRKRLRATG